MKRKEDNSSSNQGERTGNGQPLTTQRQDLVGQRYVNLLRCSALKAVDTSPEGQKRINDAFAAMSGMKLVDDIYAEGISGSQTFNREDLQDLLDLHKTKPYDIVLVHDLSRLTRGGIRHGNVVEDALRKAGIRLVSSTDLIPDGPEGDLIKSVKHYANQLQARSISLAVARGLSQSLAKGSRPAASRTPYGLDRLYSGPDGKLRMLLRWEGRVQLWLNPDTLEEMGRQVKPAKPPRIPDSKNGKSPLRKRHRRQRFKGYVKQADETSRLIPGAKDRVDTLAWIFTAYDLWGRGYHWIAQQLNDRNVPAPEGGRWVLKQIKSILYNPIYLGIEVRHRYSHALYNKITADGPMAVFVDQDELEKQQRKTFPQTEHSRDQWRLVDVPLLKDLNSRP